MSFSVMEDTVHCLGSVHIRFFRNHLELVDMD
jgi:hypothetical protein